MKQTRNTIQRDLVLGTVRALHTHPTAVEIYEHIRQEFPSISRGTVYRNLNLLAEEGSILRVEVTSGADCFDFNLNPHFHIRCSICKAVVDVEVEPQFQPLLQIRNTGGYLLQGYSFVFHGICPTCQKRDMANP